jgi:hypothetical protein
MRMRMRMIWRRINVVERDESWTMKSWPKGSATLKVVLHFESSPSYWDG